MNSEMIQTALRWWQFPGTALARLVALVSVLSCTASATAQLCDGQWVPNYGLPGVDSRGINAIISWDPDGPGPLPSVLVVGGAFTSAGGASANRVAVWDDSSGTWSPLGSGITGDVYALATLPNGDLVAGGYFTLAGGSANFIARWNGHTWSPLGLSVNGIVHALAVMPNGDLIAAGEFDTAGGVSANKVARWNGSNWSALANGVGDPYFQTFNCAVLSLVVRPSGDLIAAGCFGSRSLQRWDGTAWTPITLGTGGPINCVAVLPNGDLAIGGSFVHVGGINGDIVANYIARWNGSAWLTLGSGLNGDVRSLAVLPNGDLVVAGLFSNASGVLANNVARWNGVSWSPFSPNGNTNGPVYAIKVLPDGDVVAGGEFSLVDGWLSGRFARWSSVTHQPVDAATCPSGSASFSVTLAGSGPFTYQWQWQPPTGSSWVDIQTGLNTDPHGGPIQFVAQNPQSNTVSIASTGTWARAGVSHWQQRCIVSNACGTATSQPAQLAICPADLTCNGFIDDADFVMFAAEYDILVCSDPSMPVECPADLNRDGQVDDTDFVNFAAAYDHFECP